MGILGWLKSRWQKAAPANPPQEPEPAKVDAPEPLGDMRRIPEGHEVKAWPGEIPAPSFTRMDGGVILASTGCQSDVNVAAVRALFDAVEKRLRPPQEPILLVPELRNLAVFFDEENPRYLTLDNVVVWTLQEGTLDGWKDDPHRLQELLRGFHRIGSKKEYGRILQIVGVKKPYFDEVAWVLALVQGVGVEVREIIPEGTALIEVRRPDGSILSCIPSRSQAPLGGLAGFQPWRLNEERDRAMADGNAAEVARIDDEEMRLLESIVRCHPPGPPAPLEHAPLLRQLIQQASSGEAAARAKLNEYLLDRNTVLVIPGEDVGGGRIRTRLEGSAIAVLPDLQSAGLLEIPAGAPLGLKRPQELLDLCREAGLAILLRTSSGNGARCEVTVDVADVDALAAARKRDSREDGTTGSRS
jgi:hypothetical protein